MGKFRLKQKKKKESHSKADKKQNGNKTVMVTPSWRNKVVDEIATIATHKAVVLMLAYMMEDPQWDCDEDKIEEFFLGVDRYAEAIEDHYITLRKVCEIIKEKTGIVIGW